ncbi:unnamed protein product [Allacma fusca]|uniref:Uncharacterized protein n=1 Tax=Allacma fusca TaxID=39272 RepID=A0A8J2KJ23_9HEXA|nr:unnamed protein product [Allacma fusca]
MVLLSRSQIFASPTWTSYIFTVIIISLTITTRSSSASPGPTMIKNAHAHVTRIVNGSVTREGVWLTIRHLSSQTVGGQENYRIRSYLTYVVRTYVTSMVEIIPGKIMEWDECRYAYDGREYGCNELRYDYLKNEPVFTWVERENGDICNGAIVGGYGLGGGDLYICNFEFFDFYGMTVHPLLGHLNTRLGKCFSTWNTVERGSSKYKVLADSTYL